MIQKQTGRPTKIYREYAQKRRIQTDRNPSLFVKYMEKEINTSDVLIKIERNNIIIPQ